MTNTDVEQIKARLGIVDVVGTYVELQKAGKNYRARCPFHNERTPSFFVSPDRDTFHCFGCSKGGDIFTFVQEIEGVDFPGALQELARRAGVELKNTSRGPGRDERERMHACLERATQYFENRLKNHAEVARYLHERGFTGETIAAFRIGFAPKTWHSLTIFLRERGFTDTEIEKSGCALRSSRGLYDRFRGRIMFPITDSVGRIIAFSGRVFGEAPKDVGKYINSPETAVYTKSHVLYGLDRAKTAIRKTGAAVLTEGQMDVCAAHQAGTCHVVATSGTAFTEEHAIRLGRLARVLILAFDADAAGQDAMLRAARLSLAHGLETRIATLPHGADPADIATENPQEWARILEASTHIVSALLTHFSGEEKDQYRFKQKASSTVLPLIASIPNAIERAHFISETARALGVDDGVIRDEMARRVRPGASALKPHPGTATQRAQNGGTDQRTILEQEILGIVLWQKKASAPHLNIANAENMFARVVDASVDERAKRYSDDILRKSVFSAEEKYRNDSSLDEETALLLSLYEACVLRDKRAEVEAALRSAERAGNTADAERLLEQYNELSRAIDTAQQGGSS